MASLPQFPSTALDAPTCSGTEAYTPRPLTPSESTRLDTYYYQSPRNDHRLVAVVEPCRLALALDLEFDPSVAAYVERPRTLMVRGRKVELCFWISRKCGTESFIVFRRQAAATVPALRAEQQLCAELVEASQRAGLDLAIRKVQSILAARVANATRLELLPYVQAARRSRGISVFIEAVMTHMRKNPVSSFHGIETSLRPMFDWRDIRSATCLLVHRGDLAVNFNERLRASSSVALGAGQ